MHLIEFLLPLRDKEGSPFGETLFGQVKEELTQRFGGVTAFTRSPAEGVWQGEQGEERDEIVIVEVMADALERGWWSDYRGKLEQRFDQDEILIRAHGVERL